MQRNSQLVRRGPKMDGYNGSSIHISGKKMSPWAWITLIVAILSISQCSMKDSEEKARKAERDAAWMASPEQAFRFCIATVAGNHGTASPEQILACNKAAGR